MARICPPPAPSCSTRATAGRPQIIPCDPRRVRSHRDAREASSRATALVLEPSVALGPPAHSGRVMVFGPPAEAAVAWFVD